MEQQVQRFGVRATRGPALTVLAFVSLASFGHGLLGDRALQVSPPQRDLGHVASEVTAQPVGPQFQATTPAPAAVDRARPAPRPAPVLTPEADPRPSPDVALSPISQSEDPDAAAPTAVDANAVAPEMPSPITRLESDPPSEVTE